VRGDRQALHTPEVTGAAAAVTLGLAVQALAPIAAPGDAEAVIVPLHRREIEHHQYRKILAITPAQIGKDALRSVTGLHPGEATGREVMPIQRRRGAQQGVEIGHPGLHAAMSGLVEQMPIEAAIVVPLTPLAKFAAHEQQLLAGMQPHVAQQGAQAGELERGVPGLAAQQRALAVHHFVVGQRQHEMLLKGVPDAERELVVVVGTVDRIAGEVAQGVVHPAHVPLHAEAETAEVGRTRHHGPGGGLLGDHLGIRKVLVNRAVELTQEVHRLEVFAAAVAIGDPFALPAAVIEIEHRTDGIDPQPVHMELIQPEMRARQQKGAHLVAAVVEQVAVPFRMETLPGVGVLIEMGTVEIGEAVGVAGKM